GRLEAARDLRIHIWNPVVEYGASARSPNSSSIDIILESDRNAVQRTSQFACALFRIEFPRLRQGLLPHDGDERVELGVVSPDAREERFSKLGRSDRARPDTGARVGETQRCQLFRRLPARGERASEGNSESTASELVHKAIVVFL